VDPFFTWLESTALSIWLREEPSLWAFPFVLILHTWGLAFLVGANVAVGVRILGAARGVPLGSLERYFRVMWFGFWVNAFSGVLLLIAYPTKALTNPLFYIKLVLVAAGLLLAGRIRGHMRELTSTDLRPMPGSVRMLAIASLCCWVASITAGRFLAYTYTRLLVDFNA
jgi:hypothetical protein